MKIPREELVAHALYLAFSTFPDENLRQVIEGDEKAMETFKYYASSVLKARRFSERAEKN